MNLVALSTVAVTLTTAGFLAVVAKSVIDALAEPVRQKYPTLDMWWLIYVTWVLGGALSYLAGVNLFVELLPDFNLVAGQLMTAVVVGGGSSLIHDIFDK